MSELFTYATYVHERRQEDVREDAMTRRSRADMMDETRRKLLASARAAFAEKGFHDTSMDDLTSAVGLTRGALYHTPVRRTPLPDATQYVRYEVTSLSFFRRPPLAEE